MWCLRRVKEVFPFGAADNPVTYKAAPNSLPPVQRAFDVVRNRDGYALHSRRSKDWM